MDEQNHPSWRSGKYILISDSKTTAWGPHSSNEKYGNARKIQIYFL